MYPLPYGFIASGTFRNQPGIIDAATYTYSSAQAAASLGRDLSACLGAASCTDQDLLAALALIVDNHLASIVSNSWGEPFDSATLTSTARGTPAFLQASTTALVTSTLAV